MLPRGYSMIQRLRGLVRGCCRTGLKSLGSFEAVSGFLGGLDVGPGSRVLAVQGHLDRCPASALCHDRGLGRFVFVSTL